jgi:uncharacterized protein YbcI
MMIKPPIEIEENQIQALADDLLTAWYEAHSILGGKARALLAPHSLLIFIEDALSKAERTLADQPRGNLLLERYLQSLLQQIGLEKQELVERVTGRRVQSTGVQVDGAAGWVLFVFNFDENDR